MAVALSVDVEDWYDGMAHLGHPIPAPHGAKSGLTNLAELLSGAAPGSQVTLFVVGNYAARVRSELQDLVAAGHEVASHGPDHGAVPGDPQELEEWLRRGRQMVEDLVQRAVIGFRSPRFEVPGSLGLARYREAIARAGFHYVSDRDRLGAESAVRELPVLTRGRFPLGGGSYQRLLPRRALRPLLQGQPGPTVLYYHSYDFDATLPSPWTSRSLAVLKQVVARSRIPGIVGDVLANVGSVSCQEASSGL